MLHTQQLNKLASNFNPVNAELYIQSDNYENNELKLGSFTNNLTMNQFLNGIQHITAMATREFHDFDQDTRKWKKTVYTNKQFNQLLANTYNNKNVESQFILYNKNYNTYKINYPNFSHAEIYKVLRNLSLRNTKYTS